MSVENRVLSLAISSWVDGSIQFDLSHLFNKIPQGSLGYFRRQDTSQDDPFTFSLSTLMLSLGEDLSAYAGTTHRITVTYHEPADGAAPSNDDPVIVQYELDYGNYDHKVSHVLFGDTGFLLDPYYDSKVIIYDDVI